MLGDGGLTAALAVPAGPDRVLSAAGLLATRCSIEPGRRFPGRVL